MCAVPHRPASSHPSRHSQEEFAPKNLSTSPPQKGGFGVAGTLMPQYAAEVQSMWKYVLVYGVTCTVCGCGACAGVAVLAGLGGTHLRRQ